MGKQKSYQLMQNKHRFLLKIILFILFFTQLFFSHPMISNNECNSSVREQSSYDHPQYYFLDNFFGKTATLLQTFRIEANAIISDSKNNSYFTGTTDLDIFYNTEIFVGKMNSTGNVLWINNWKHYQKNYANDLTIDESNKQLFVIGESLTNINQSYSDILLSCIDYETGLEIWNTTIGDANYSEGGKSILYYENRLFIAAVQTKNFQVYTNPNIILLCLNSTNGVILWEQVFSNSLNDDDPKLTFDTVEERIYLSFNRENMSTLPIQNYYFLQKYDLLGNLIWNFSSINSLYPRILDIKVNPFDQQIYLIGDCYEPNNYKNKDIILFIHNSLGEITSTIIFGFPNKDETAKAISFQNENSYFICGGGETNIENRHVALLAHLTSEGYDWFTKGERFAFSNINDMVCLSSGDFIMVGNCNYDFDYLYKRLLLSFSKDSDFDKLSDYWEPIIGTDPNEKDTDHDGYSDYDEYYGGTDPLNPRSFPKRRIFWRNFGLGFSVSMVGIFFFLQLNIFFIGDKRNDEKNMKSFIVKAFDKLYNKIKKKK
ncbi:MAG: PQQ-like beta-propeller repeat protein [Candidatus Heimdallarchaeota archaeon]|nr:PQQ-like beta-propeller repeat protein [Candidatus Heimdallarchaeota archaeon]